MASNFKIVAPYKLYGYVIPPIDVVDFLPLVYTNNDQFYFAESENGIINDFVQFRVAEDAGQNNSAIDYIPGQNIIKTVITKTRSKGQNTLYCYKGPDNQIMIGEFFDLVSYLSSLLVHKDCNEFARLTLARFLGLTGMRFQLIDSINKSYRQKTMNFRIAEPDIDQFVELKDFDDLDQVIRQTAELINITAHFDWNDFMYIYKDNVLIADYRMDYDDFKDYHLAFQILETFFSKSRRATEAIVSNKAVFHDALYSEMVPAIDDEEDFGRCYWVEKSYTSDDPEDTDDFSDDTLDDKKEDFKKYRLALQSG